MTDRWTHVRYIEGRLTGCIGRHASNAEMDTLGHCTQFCGSAECAVRLNDGEPNDWVMQEKSDD